MTPKLGFSQWLAFVLTSIAFQLSPTGLPTAGAVEPGCPGGNQPNSNVVMCEDFETTTFPQHWDIGSNLGTWPVPGFVICQDGFGFNSRCAAWSNYLVFDNEWGFYGYDGWRPFPAQSEFHVRWYQYISDPYTWGTLEDKSVMLHDPAATITAYVATSRNQLPDEPHSGPGKPFVANYQDLDWPETGGAFTKVNRFQNQGRDITLQPGKWYLFEWYIKLNTPGRSNGVTKLWIDDASQPIAAQTLRMHYTDMRWLRQQEGGKKFGFVRLTVYHQRCDFVPNTCPPQGLVVLPQSHRWDQIVVSRRPIGPIVAAMGPPCDHARAVPVLAWPPQYWLIPVTIPGLAPAPREPIRIRAVRLARESLADAGTANAKPDVVTHGPVVLLRVDPAARGHGLTYEVDFIAQDASADQCRGTVSVQVPPS